jgi:hypothetical protein
MYNIYNYIYMPQNIYTTACKCKNMYVLNNNIIVKSLSM